MIGANFWDTNVWSFVLTLTILLVAMMVANVLRRSIKPLRRLMIPSAVVGGFLILIADAVFKLFAGQSMFGQSVTLEALTYHGLGLGFVAMTLRSTEKQKRGERASAFNSGVTVVGGYLVQAVAGLAISILLYYVMDSFFASGMLLPMGYGQGPGQAYNWGHNYEVTYRFQYGTSFGLTVAAMGFISASVGGVIYLNILRRRGAFKGDTGRDVQDVNLSAQTITGGNEIPLTESMDKLTVQIALVFIAYIAAYAFMKGVNGIIESGAMGDFGYNTVQPLLWGFNFLFGTLFAILLKTLIRFLRKKNVIHRDYTNDFMQSRIAGFMFDLMVVASIAAIDLSAFRHSAFVVPLTLICVAGCVLTYGYMLIVSRRVFPGYQHEAFLSLFGMLTGTASTGVILLREIDPHFTTPASDNLVYHQPWAIVFGFPMLLLLSVAPQNIGSALVTLGILIALTAGMMLILFRKDIFHAKGKRT